MGEAQPLKSREYETIYILRSDVDADTADKVQGRVAEVVTRDDGKLVKVEAWGRRKLAYPVAKQKRGVYVYVKYVGRGGLVAELERNLKLQDAVLKFQTVQTKDEVDAAGVEVDPEEIKFQRLELPTDDDEKEESRERALGLVETEGAPRSMRPEEGPSEGASDAPPEQEGGEAAEAKAGEAKAGEAKAGEAKAAEGEAKAADAKAGEGDASS